MNRQGKINPRLRLATTLRHQIRAPVHVLPVHTLPAQHPLQVVIDLSIARNAIKPAARYLGQGHATAAKYVVVALTPQHALGVQRVAQDTEDVSVQPLLPRKSVYVYTPTRFQFLEETNVKERLHGARGHVSVNRSHPTIFVAAIEIPQSR